MVEGVVVGQNEKKSEALLAAETASVSVFQRHRPSP